LTNPISVFPGFRASLRGPERVFRRLWLGAWCFPGFGLNNITTFLHLQTVKTHE
jgi:hypothetical protein